jgi:secondary thiamine-phosphate synthase enzyme
VKFELFVSVMHTSASLTINENWDSDVRMDMETALNRMVPEEAQYRHDCEGPDDMPAHVKTSLMGASLNIPLSNGSLAVGTWQGIWMNEHRDHPSARSIMVTIHGMAEE